jgi:hypothetical protein
LGLFDERDLLEISSTDYPGERLVACRNPELANLLTHKHEEPLAPTERTLERINVRVDAGKLAGADEIGPRNGIHVVRTSISAAQMDAPECVRNYKAVANVERAFRSVLS